MYRHPYKPNLIDDLGFSSRWGKLYLARPTIDGFYWRTAQLSSQVVALPGKMLPDPKGDIQCL